MKLSGNFQMMGVEKNVNTSNGEIYFKVGLMQGIQSKVFYVNEELYNRYQDIPMGTPVYVEVTVNERDKKTFFQIDALRVVSPAKKNDEKAS